MDCYARSGSTVSVINWGKFGKACLLRILWASLCLQEKDMVSFVRGQHLSHGGFMTCFMREGQNDFPVSAVYSNSFSL